MKTTSTLAVALLLFSISALAQQPAKTPAKAKKTAPVVEATKPATDAATGPSIQTAEAFLRRMFGYNESLVFKVSSVKPTGAQGVSEVTSVVNTPQGQQILKFFVTGDGEHAIMGEMVPFGLDPFVKNRELLKKEAFGAAKGPADAPMQIVEFADLECPACKAVLPTVERLQQDFPTVRFIFQSFPLEQLHPWAATGAKYLDCIARQSNEASWSFISSVYSHQSEITAENAKAKLAEYATAANQDAAKIAACAETPETSARIQKSIQLANQANVTSTPTLFVNGRGIAGINPQDYDAVKSIVQYELTQASTK